MPNEDAKILDFGELGQKFQESLVDEAPAKVIEVEDVRSHARIREAFKTWKSDNKHLEKIKDFEPLSDHCIIHLFYYKPAGIGILGADGNSATTGFQLFPFCKVLKTGKRVAEYGIKTNQIYYLDKNLFIGFHQPYDWSQGIPKSGHAEASVILEIDRPSYHLVVNYEKKDLDDMFFRLVTSHHFKCEFNGVI